MVRHFFASLALLVTTPTAAAEWREVETKHFKIVSSGSEKDLLRFGERLESFHTVLVLATGAKEAGYRIVKVRVFLVPGIADVKRLYNGPQKNIAGYYSTRDDGAIAVVPRMTGDGDFSGQLVLFHEYAHHFMLQYTPAAYPSWYVEGFAEIASTSSFERKGAVTFGKAASHRENELVYGKRYSTAKLLQGNHPRYSGEETSWSYGDAWLLTHYLTFADNRRGQLRAYLTAINAGTKPFEASLVFGDLATLEREVNAYLAASNFPYRAVPIPADAKLGIQSRILGAAESALIEQTIELESITSLPTKDDDRKEPATKGEGPKPVDFATRLTEATTRRSAWLAQLETLANSFPNDPYGWRLLADARCKSEQYSACAAASDRALTLSPSDVRASLRKAEALLAQARDQTTQRQDADISAARALITKAKTNAPDDPLALIAYYRSFGRRGTAAPADAIDALRSAVRLIPQLYGPRLTLASELIARGNLGEARAILRPLANSPHESGASVRARAMLEEIETKLDAL